MLDPLQVVKKPIQICKDVEWALDSKNKMLLPPQSHSICNFFYFHHSNLTSIFGVFNIKSLCDGTFTVDVTTFFGLFCFDFHVGSRRHQYWLAVTTI